MVPTSLLLARLSDSSCARPAKDAAPWMGPARPRPGSHKVVTRPLAPRPGSHKVVTRPLAPPSQLTPSHPQQEAPDHMARRRTAAPPLRLPAKPRSARRSSGWHAAAVLVAAGKIRSVERSCSSSQYFAIARDLFRNTSKCLLLAKLSAS
ncbi:hypothetical protein BRADI_5g22879v3 [Brachypodium distachyon]|uniref:Uncharacterized protein n=1 Tax=Brachypodium distachyon TaxID=15368 RepID=A0A2K2CIQ4_BRADI|nr:hypothetical protein BRADI_5g22879v3 [Brachypodium distachyon]